MSGVGVPSASALERVIGAMATRLDRVTVPSCTGSNSVGAASMRRPPPGGRGNMDEYLVIDHGTPRAGAAGRQAVTALGGGWTARHHGAGRRGTTGPDRLASSVPPRRAAPPCRARGSEPVLLQQPQPDLAHR